MAGPVLLRWLRALTLASVVVLAGLGAHVAAGGTSPSAALAVLLLLAVTAAVAPLLGRPVSNLKTVLLLLGGQAFVHAALAFTATRPAAVPHTAGMPMPGHDVMAAGEVMLHGAAPRSVSSILDLATVHPAMLLAHVTASVVVGVWLAAGERAVWTVVALAARPVLRFAARLAVLARGHALAARVDVPPSVASIVSDSRDRVTRSVWCGRTLPRRGPPALVA
jgi:hypothetical protein